MTTRSCYSLVRKALVCLEQKGEKNEKTSLRGIENVFLYTCDRIIFDGISFRHDIDCSTNTDDYSYPHGDRYDNDYDPSNNYDDKDRNQQRYGDNDHDSKIHFNSLHDGDSYLETPKDSSRWRWFWLETYIATYNRNGAWFIS